MRNLVVARPRREPVAAVAVCSEYGFDVRLAHPPRPPDVTPLQALIESRLTMPSRAWLVTVGGVLTFSFLDEERLGSIDLYWNFADAPQRALEPPDPAALPVRLGFEDADLAADRFSIDASVSAALDRAGGRVRVDLDGGLAIRWHALADTLLLGTDDAGGIASLMALDVRWRSEAPAPRPGLLARLKRATSPSRRNRP